MADWTGHTLSRVTLEKRIGRGGMADVFLGRHITLERPVAVKILHAFLNQDPDARARFHSEARAVAGLHHPHIVQVFDFDEVDGRPYIVMELIEGPTLEDHLAVLHAAGSRLAPETAARLVFALAMALDYAHARGIVHRDVKPANVLLRCSGEPPEAGGALPIEVEPVLTDFGVAHLAGTGATVPGTLIGTPIYMAPEIALGQPAGARADIYSLGVMLYEMLAGRPPFDPCASQTPLAVLLQHVQSAPPPVPGIGPRLQAVLDRALAKDPAARYAGAGDLAAELLPAVFSVPGPLPAATTASLDGLLDTLELLVEQARAYESALPPNNYPARAAVAMLGDLARRAVAEARDLTLAARPAAAPHPFSPREHEVLALAAQGLTNKEIAYRLGLSERTIQFHVNSIFNKTGTSSRTEAVSLALRSGWL